LKWDLLGRVDYGEFYQSLCKLRSQDEAAVYRFAALQMRCQLEKGYSQHMAYHYDGCKNLHGENLKEYQNVFAANGVNSFI
jgi:hypothetical protein